MKLLLLVLAFFFVGCASNVDKKEVVPAPRCGGSFTYVPADYTAGQVEAFKAIQDSWNDFIGYEVVTLTADPVQHETCQIVVVDKIEIDGETFQGYFLDSPSNNILIIASLYTTELAAFQNLLEHEIGHSLGLVHEAGGIMDADTAFDFNENDKEQLQSLGY